ncbi:MAG: arginine deiminase-related protein [Spirosomataceae bacterium]|jgi:hypothetical protein
MQEQITSNILMIRPVNFAYNEETAGSNAFQKNIEASDPNASAQVAFDSFVEQLQLRGINVTVVQDTPNPFTPDSIFPNNWLSMHHSGKAVLYPMMAENRRQERRHDILDLLREKYHLDVVLDFTHFEDDGMFLEGTGSLVLDRIKRIAYATISPRTNTNVLNAWKNQMNYELVTFHANDRNGEAIYHTNVVMSMGDIFCVICLEAITDFDERVKVKARLEQSGKEVVEITMEQMENFAGNMLLLKNDTGKKFLVMSQRAYDSLSRDQKRNLEDNAEVIHPDLGIIEELGGGSARCMIAEIHLPLK